MFLINWWRLIDAVLEKDNDTTIVEEAMGQIKEKKYYEKYIGNDVSLLAIAFGDKKEIACRFEKL
jgi:hypothetical protein